MSRQRPTKEELRKIKVAAKQLNTKLRLERQLAKKIRRFLKRQNDEFLRRWRDSGEVLDAIEYQEELEQILGTHYAKTSTKFSRGIVKEINLALREIGEEPISNGDPSIVGALLAFIRHNVTDSSNAITNTSNKEISFAMNEFDGDGVQVHKKLSDRVMPRSESIGVTETQKAAEGSKSVTVRTGQDIAVTGAVALIVFETTKTWITRQDGVVRPAHDFALFQEVPENETYLVGGEELMYPGDMSFSASLWNVINCRCVSLFNIHIRRLAA